VRQPWSPAGVKSSSLPLASALLIARELSLFTKSDLEEGEEQASGQSSRHQDDCEDFARHSPDQRGTRSACDDQRGRRGFRIVGHPDF